MRQSKRWKQPLQYVARGGTHGKGFVLISVVILTTSIMAVVFIQTALNSLTTLGQSSAAFTGTQLRMHTEGCVDEALVRLGRNPNFGGASFTLGNGTCFISVSGSLNEKSMSISGSLSEQNYSMQVTVDAITMTITNYDF